MIIEKILGEQLDISDDRKFIMAQPDAGLGNRLRCIFTGLYFSKLYGVPLDVLWLRENCCNVEYSDLFEISENIRVHTIYHLGYKNRYALKSFASDRFLVILKKNLKYFDAGMSDRLYAAKGEEGFVNEIENNPALCFMSSGQHCTNEHFAQSRELIKPTKEIQNRVEDIMSPYMDKRLIGIHIRRTDHVDAIANSSLESFIEIMKRESAVAADINKKEVYFYLATDDLQIEEKLQKEFSCIPHINFAYTKSRNTSAGMKDAYVDMLCLSKCEKIFGSYESSFSKMAAVIGDIVLEIA